MSSTCLLAAMLSSAGGLAQETDPGQQARQTAQAYLDNGNNLWAAKTLIEQVLTTPNDAQSRAWATWVLLQDGDLLRAQRLLDDASPGASALDQHRMDLLWAALHQLEQQPGDAADLLADLRRADALYPEDRSMLASLRRDLLGDRGEPVSARVQLEGGWASNVIESAPQDVGSGQGSERQPQAPVAALDAVLRYEPWAHRLARPVGELRAKGFTPIAADTAGFGYLSTGTRIGAELGPPMGTHARLLYAGELMGLRGDPNPDALAEGIEPVEGAWIMEAHRGDVELDLGSTVQLFGGVGRRINSELPRTRTEADIGGAVVLPLGLGWNLTALATGRRHWARHPGWDAWGVTGLLRLRAPLPGDHMFKARGMVLWDSWPNFFQWEPTVLQRDDLALRVELGPWSRDLNGWRVGLTYNLATRASSANAYDFTDHRALLELRWQGGWNPVQPRAAALETSHQALPWGLEEGHDLGLDRVQDLLRQEDSARRGSSCAD